MAALPAGRGATKTFREAAGRASPGQRAITRPVGVEFVDLKKQDKEGMTRRTQFTRRAALAGTAAFAFVPMALNFSARAAAPAAGKQAPGFYRYKVGDIEVTVVTDGVVRAKLADNFVTNVKVDEVKAALAAAHMRTETFNNTFTPIVLNTGGKLVLIDTGVGEGGFNATKGTAGQFTSNLAAAGLKPESIDTVIISHYHGDHMNGLLKADGSLTYPNAEIEVRTIAFFGLAD